MPLRRQLLNCAGFAVTSARVYVALGSNLGDREAHIRQACTDIKMLAACSNMRCSSVYETDPMGPQNQPDYLNAVCEFDYASTARHLLPLLQGIEQAHGRVQTVERWSARALDLDIVLFGDQQLRTLELTIPHVGIAERSFVLWPLAELDSALHIPGHGPVDALLADCEGFGIRIFNAAAK